MENANYDFQFTIVLGFCCLFLKDKKFSKLNIIISIAYLVYFFVIKI